MIIDIPRFLVEERKYWAELEQLLNKTETDPLFTMNLDQVKRLHYLYQRTSADLAKIMTFASEPEIRRYLELLVGRAYGEVHETRAKPHRFTPLRWFFQTFPRTVRRHIGQFWLAAAVTLAGCMFGAFAVGIDPDAKENIMPIRALMERPSERVAEEEEVNDEDPVGGMKMSGSAWYMTHNTRVAILVLAMGLTWGFGTILVLFYNGVMMGAIALDYMFAGETEFLLGWLMPHGVIEIPAILLAGQAGLITASALIGWGGRSPLKRRLRAVASDVVTLITGVAILLAWAGFVEAFLSQYHEPVIPYPLKISFGLVELILLVLFLSWSGRGRNLERGVRGEIPGLARPSDAR